MANNPYTQSFHDKIIQNMKKTNELLKPKIP